MRKVLLIDRPVDDEALAEADGLGASELIFCPNGSPPPALEGLTMGYHELDEPEAEAVALMPVSVVAERLAMLGLSEGEIESVLAG